MARSGRRTGGGTGTQQAILDAARAAFAETGYDGATIRGIAGRAGVDPALVHHYFGNKERLFVAAMQLPIDPAAMIPALLAPGVDGLGERLARMFLTIWEDSPSVSGFMALIRSAMSHEASAAMLREFISTAVIGRVIGALDADRPRFRAGLVGTQLVGLAITRYIVKLPPMVEASRDEVIAAIAPTIQRYLTGPLD
jgi:AcrR family transcriptional regulator